ncbi:alpha/beta fold hydrolase [Bacteroidota bacterium]
MELNYKKLGEGPPLIIVHGLYGCSDNWLSVGKALADQYTVYLLDQRNHGKSPHSKIHDYTSMRNDLVEFMDRHELSRAVLIGHSMGGKTVMFLAEAFPERIEALIVIDIAPTAYYSGRDEGQLSVHEKIMDSMLAVDFKRVKKREDVDDQLARTIDSPRIRSFLLKNVSRSDEAGFYWNLNIPVLQQSLPKILDGLDAEKYSGGEEIAGFPVLFIRGEKSEYITDEDIQVIQQIFPMARVTTIPGAGHWLHVEQSALLVKTIRYFL